MAYTLKVYMPWKIIAVYLKDLTGDLWPAPPGQYVTILVAHLMMSLLSLFT